MNDWSKRLRLFWVFFKVGSVTFGGGLAMLPLIQKEVVERQKWIDEDEIIDVFAIAQSLPGVVALNTAVFVGKKVGGIWGAVMAVLGVSIPAFASILLILIFLSSFKGNVYVDKALSGIKAASAALILLTTLKLGKSAIKGKIGYIIALISFLAIAVLNISAAYAIVFGGLVGLAIYYYDRRRATK